MAVVVVTSSTPGAGKTGVAAAIARHYAYLGRPVKLARLEGADGDPAADAAYFASLPFAPGSSAGTLAAGDVRDPGGQELLVVEADTEAAAKIADATVVFVARDERPKSAPEGITPAAVIVTDVAPALAGEPQQAEGQPLIIELPEDRVLAGFSVAEAKAMLNADVLVEGDDEDVTCDELVIAPIASDAGQPYFTRFGSEAVVVRFDKTDQHLAAMRADPAVLILTGGRRPSDYTFDAAGAKGITVLLSRTDTENTVIALEGIFDQTRFQGERKLDRMVELLEETPLFHTLEL
ncbi:MAG: DRTGG domain-containing protein [Hyphomicrobiales bacterium]